MNQIKRSAVITALISTSLYTTNAFAHGDDKHTIEELDSTTAIARRANQLIESTGSTIYSMEPDALRSIGILNLTDALEQLPGVIIASSGQQGVRQAIRLRGLRSGDVQLRIDGIRLSNRLANQSIFSANTALNGLSKIELIQGGQAALYGGGSTAGVISLTTKRGTSDMKNRFSLEAGSFNSLSLETERGGRWKKLSYYLSSKYSTTDNDTFGDNSEARGFDNDSINQNNALRLGYDLRDDLELGLTFRSNRSETETPQGFSSGSRVESDFYLGTIYADYQVTDKLHSKLTFSYLTEDTDFGGGSGANYDQFGIVLENAYQYSGTSSLNFGIEYENQDYSGYGTPNGQKDHYSAIYLNHAYDLQNLTVESGIRHENYQSFGSHTSWKAGLRYDLNDKKTELRANIATGFKTPNLIQLFSPLAFGLAGNPDVNPETSLSWDLGVDHQLTDKHKASVTFFQADLDDGITGDRDLALYVNTPGKSTASGIEAALNGDITDEISYKLNYTWLDQSFNDQPQQQTNAQVVFKPNDKLQLGFGAQYLDLRKYGGDQLGDVFLVRLFGSYQISDHVQLHGRIENLTDTEYSQFSGFGSDFPARRLGVHAGVTLEW